MEGWKNIILNGYGYPKGETQEGIILNRKSLKPMNNILRLLFSPLLRQLFKKWDLWWEW